MTYLIEPEFTLNRAGVCLAETDEELLACIKHALAMSPVGRIAIMSNQAILKMGRDAEQLARLFHETYERLAPEFGYETRVASRKRWEEVPEANRLLMIAVCREVLAKTTQ